MQKSSQLKVLSGDEIPEMLREIPDAPEKLYVEGTLPAPGTKILCVVGSRKFTPYGKDACEKLISGLRGYDVAIVSGLALGIDTIAHKAALDAGLKTIAVPAQDSTVPCFIQVQTECLQKKFLKPAEL